MNEIEIPRPLSKQPMPNTAKKVFEGKVFEIYQWEQVQFDGSIAVFEKAKRDDTVVVIASLPDKKLLLIEDEQPARGTVLTFPGGRIDAGESPFTAVKRELLEETGYVSDEWTLWKAYQPITKMDWATYIFVARNCNKISEISLDAGERITLMPVTFDELIALSRDSRFQGEDIRLELTDAKFDSEARKLLEKIIFG
jgi:ADP-ribose pyrophosphatase